MGSHGNTWEWFGRGMVLYHGQPWKHLVCEKEENHCMCMKEMNPMQEGDDDGVTRSWLVDGLSYEGETGLGVGLYWS